MDSELFLLFVGRTAKVFLGCSIVGGLEVGGEHPIFGLRSFICVQALLVNRRFKSSVLKCTNYHTILTFIEMGKRKAACGLVGSERMDPYRKFFVGGLNHIIRFYNAKFFNFFL